MENLHIRLRKSLKKQSYDLIETAAEKLCEFILLEYSLVKKVKVSLKKPWAPILRSLDTVSIEKEREDGMRHTFHMGLI